ncbi:uncharacterized protein B0T15DRAFT_495440 [Chaetomium strumarium]|uniref:Uncharacterized protein n=1 Tax=Chaetomium strumarium TaxID=1170767 RepID=A0AAJ0LYY1_9PEZI|nr:hypothetical protein B0T15DRAFT_495440 [Chaetomium strumarium]
MASMSTLLAHMNRTEIPRYRKGLPVAYGSCTPPCPLCGHLYAPGPGLWRHFATRYSDKLGEQSESAARLASAIPAGEMQGIHKFEELLR